MTRVRRLGRDTFTSLHNRNYRLYFIGQTASVSGTWMQQLAQAWLVLRLTDNSGTALGLVTALQFLPMLLFGAWGGVLADRFEKRKLLLGTQIAAGFLALVLGIIVSTGNVALWNVYLMSVLLGFVNVVDNPARQTFVLEMVGREDLPNAVSLNSVVMNSSRIVGPAIGAVLIGAFGVGPCFYINAASYGAVIVALLMMNVSLLHRLPTVERAKGQLREGLRYAWSEPMVRIPLLMMAVIGTLAFNFQVVIPLIATKTFHTGAGGIGLLLSTMGAGAVLGGLSVASRRGVSYKRLITLSMAMGVTILLAALAPSLAAETVAMFAMGAAAFAFIAVANTTIQLTSAPEMRGRVMALYAIAFLGSTPVGGPHRRVDLAAIRRAVRLRDRRDRDDRRDRLRRLVAGPPSRGSRDGPRTPARGRGRVRRLSPNPSSGRSRSATAGSPRPSFRRAADTTLSSLSELAAGAPLPEQVPTLVEGDLELAQPRRIVPGRFDELLLFGDQVVDVREERSVVHGLPFEGSGFGDAPTRWPYGCVAAQDMAPGGFGPHAGAARAARQTAGMPLRTRRALGSARRALHGPARRRLPRRSRLSCRALRCETRGRGRIP